MRSPRLRFVASAMFVTLAVAGCAASVTPTDTDPDLPAVDIADADTDAAKGSDPGGLCAGAAAIDFDALLRAALTSGPSTEDVFEVPTCRATADMGGDAVADGEFTFAVGTEEQLGIDACDTDSYFEPQELDIAGGVFEGSVESDSSYYPKDSITAGVPTADGRCASLSIARVTDGVDDPFTSDEVSGVMTALLDGAGIAY